MYRKVSVDSLPLTPELAAEFAALPPLPGERDIRLARRMYLLVQVQRGKFSGPDWADGRCLSTGQIYRLDGQHSSDMLTTLPNGTAFPTDLLATITHYEFDSMGDAADVFNLFNNPRSVRNNADMMGTYAAQVPDLEGYARDFLVDVANGFYEYELKRHAAKAKDAVLLPSRERGIYFMVPNRPDFLELTHWLATFREQKNASFLHRSIIVADMLTHHAAEAAIADAFWQLVFSESHPDPYDETRMLAEWFREQLAVSAKPKLDMKAFRRKTAIAWKRFKLSTSVAA